MSELIDGTAAAVNGDDRFRNPDGTPATWVHTYTPAERLRRTMLPLCIGAVSTLGLLWFAYHDNSIASSWPVAFGPFAISLLLALVRWRAKTGRRYSSEGTSAARGQRWRDARPFIILYLFVQAFVIAGIFGTTFKPDYWQLILIAPLVLLAPGLFALAGRGKSGYTTAARGAHHEHWRTQHYRTAAQSEPTWLDNVFKQWWFRYPLGLLIGWAYFTQMLPDPRMTGARFWIVTLGVIGIVIAATREVSLVLIGGAILFAIGYGIFGAIAALPVGAAIIIGALIIASAISNKTK